MMLTLFHYKMRITGIFFILFGLSFSTSAQVQNLSNEHNPGFFHLNVAYHPRFVRTEVAYESKVLWRSSSLEHPLELHLEGSVAYWHANHSNHTPKSRNALWQVGLTPMMRWWLTDHWYLEGGIGPTLMSHTRFLNKDISTALQFGDHIGIGRALNDKWRFGIRYSHFSNASIKRPNPGFNMLHFSISRSL